MLGLIIHFPDLVRAELVLLAVAAVAAGMCLWAGRALRQPENRRSAVSALAVGLAGLGYALGAWFAAGLAKPGAILLFASLFFGSSILVAYARVHGHLGAGRMSLLATLRWLSVLAVLVLILRPSLQTRSSGRAAPAVALLVDYSKSMSINDLRNQPSRYKQAVSAVQLQQNSIQTGRLVAMRFAEHAEPVPNADALSRLEPAGQATNLARAITEAAASVGEDLFAIVVLSDGNHNLGPDPVAAARKIGVPVHAVGVGGLEAPAGTPDLAVLKVEAPDEASARSRCKVTAHIAGSALRDARAEVLLKKGQVVLAREAVQIDSDRFRGQVELGFVPQQAGIEELTVTVEPHPLEANTQNNTAAIRLLVTEPQIRALYLEGRIRPEYRALRRALSSDPSIELATAVQVRPPLWQVGGTVAGTPVRRFPAEARGFQSFLEPFNVIIIGDIDARQLGTDRMRAIEQAVRRGAGLLMVGGQHNFGPGHYSGTPLEDALPVRAGREKLADGGSRQDVTPFVPRVTAAGRSHPATSGLAEILAALEKPNLPPLRGCVLVDEAKPAAEVLLENPVKQHRGRPAIVLAVQNYGKGRSAAFTADTTYLWYQYQPILGAESPYQRFWNQLIRWLASGQAAIRDEKALLLVKTDRATYPPAETVTIRAIVRLPRAKTGQEVRVEAIVEDAQGKQRSVSLAETEPGAGRFTGRFSPTDSGIYTVKALAKTKGNVVAQDRSQFQVVQAGLEDLRVARNEDLLRKIAEVSGGRYVELAQLGQLLYNLDQAAREVLASGRPVILLQPFEHPGTIFLAAVALLTLEWLLRRRWQLA